MLEAAKRLLAIARSGDGQSLKERIKRLEEDQFNPTTTNSHIMNEPPTNALTPGKTYLVNVADSGEFWMKLTYRFNLPVLVFEGPKGWFHVPASEADQRVKEIDEPESDKPLTADDLVVGEEYEMLDGNLWEQCVVKWKGKSSVVLNTATTSLVLTSNTIPLFVRRLPANPPALSFGDPPPGHTWHNPENLTPEQVEVDKGWRLCCEDEVDDFAHECWINRDSEWVKAGSSGGKTFKQFAAICPSVVATYRTKAPLPEPVTSESDQTDYAAENIRLTAELKTARAELARLSWRPVSERPEAGDGCELGCVVVWSPTNGMGIDYVNEFETWDESYTHWRPVAPPKPPAEPQPDPAFLRWKDEVSAGERDAALFAGWKALQEGGAA